MIIKITIHYSKKIFNYSKEKILDLTQYFYSDAKDTEIIYNENEKELTIYYNLKNDERKKTISNVISYKIEEIAG